MSIELSKEDIAERLLGAWDLRSWIEIYPDGTTDYPLGESARGQIIYTSDGHMAAQLVKTDRSTFESEDWRKASDVESARGFKEYFGYFGTFSLDMEKKAVIHRIDGAWFPNLLGTDQIRFFHFEGDGLVLDADTKWGKVRIEWTRAKNAGSSI
jgi:Lipocalin-like domain